MNGTENNWTIAGNSTPKDGLNYENNSSVFIAYGGYWPEIAVDSSGNLYGIYSKRTNSMKYCFKPYGGDWVDRGFLLTASSIGFYGLCVAKNNNQKVFPHQFYNYPFLLVLLGFLDNILSQSYYFHF